ncbi:hypothetical protein BC827DRAFT_22513 [Russula dissimulans]|nr:hypothetical protein BC827DRAFT_22513 [Russula dissimulans]
MATTETEVEPPSEFASHEVRITQSGKIHAWVQFALKFFEENEEKALVLHTLPVAAKGKSRTNEMTEPAAGEGNGPQNNPLLPQGTEEKKRGPSVSTITIPRLISVVEIIKREYLAAMNTNRSPDLVGLYQYNEVGSLEERVENESEKEEDAEDRRKMITEALIGTKNVRIARSPYMKVTLCRKELVGMKAGRATHR